MEYATLLTFAVALAVAAATPGPGIAAVVARALGSGLAGTVPMIGGLVVGDLLFLALSAFGLALFAAEFGTFFLLIKWLGAAYLLYIAWALWRAPAEVPDPGSSNGRPVRAFLVGLSVTLGNPKVIVFYLALLPSLVDLERLTLVEFAELGGAVIGVLVAVMTGYAALAARARTLFRTPGAVRLLNRAAGSVMAGAALSIAARA